LGLIRIFFFLSLFFFSLMPSMILRTSKRTFVNFNHWGPHSSHQNVAVTCAEVIATQQILTKIH
jgi:hypothetical protein